MLSAVAHYAEQLGSITVCVCVVTHPVIRQLLPLDSVNEPVR